MVRRRKRRIQQAPNVAFDEIDIETQVERDRLKELQPQIRPQSESSDCKLEKSESNKSETLKSEEVITDKRNSEPKQNWSHRREVSLFNSENYKSLEEQEVNVFDAEFRRFAGSEIHSESLCVSAEFKNTTKITKTEVLAKDKSYDERNLSHGYITLGELKSLTEDTDCLGIDGDLIVQSYLQRLDATSDANSDDSDVRFNVKNEDRKKSTKDIDTATVNNSSNNKTNLCCYYKHKSSMRKKSLDETNKSSVSFQIQNYPHTRRIKSAGLVHDQEADSMALLTRPSTATHKISVNSGHNETNVRTDETLPYSSKIQAQVSPPSINGCPVEQEERKRKTSAVSKHSTFSSCSRRKSASANFDPELEKASVYIHGGDKNFSRANTSIIPVKYGLKFLQMNYSENNLEHNQSIIFVDLLKNSCNKSHMRCAEIRNVEKRLEMRRRNPLYSTTFYEHKNIRDPYRLETKKVARTVAQKKKERKEKIKKKSDEICTGYVPTCLTMKIAGRQEVEHIGRNCRYLRCNPPPLWQPGDSPESVEVVKYTSSESC